MSGRATPIVLMVEEWNEMRHRVRARTSSQQAAQRGRIVLRAAEGARNLSFHSGPRAGAWASRERGIEVVIRWCKLGP